MTIDKYSLAELEVEAAMLAQHSYRHEYECPANYTLFCDSDDLGFKSKAGFHASSYVRQLDNNQVAILSSYTGTDFINAHKNRRGNLITDFKFTYNLFAPAAIQFELEAHQHARAYCEKIIAEAKLKYPNQQIIFYHVGHSLGGIHCQLLGVEYPEHYAISYESPGVREQLPLEKQMGEFKNIKNVIITHSIISHFGTHVGEVIELPMAPDDLIALRELKLKLLLSEDFYDLLKMIYDPSSLPSLQEIRSTFFSKGSITEASYTAWANLVIFFSHYLFRYNLDETLGITKVKEKGRLLAEYVSKSHGIQTCINALNHAKKMNTETKVSIQFTKQLPTWDGHQITPEILLQLKKKYQNSPLVKTLPDNKQQLDNALFDMYGQYTFIYVKKRNGETLQIARKSMLQTEPLFIRPKQKVSPSIYEIDIDQNTPVSKLPDVKTSAPENSLYISYNQDRDGWYFKFSTSNPYVALAMIGLSVVASTVTCVFESEEKAHWRRLRQAIGQLKSARHHQLTFAMLIEEPSYFFKSFNSPEKVFTEWASEQRLEMRRIIQEMKVGNEKSPTSEKTHDMRIFCNAMLYILHYENSKKFPQGLQKDLEIAWSKDEFNSSVQFYLEQADQLAKEFFEAYSCEDFAVAKQKLNVMRTHFKELPIFFIADGFRLLNENNFDAALQSVDKSLDYLDRKNKEYSQYQQKIKEAKEFIYRNQYCFYIKKIALLNTPDAEKYALLGVLHQFVDLRLNADPDNLYWLRAKVSALIINPNDLDKAILLQEKIHSLKDSSKEDIVFLAGLYRMQGRDEEAVLALVDRALSEYKAKQSESQPIELIERLAVLASALKNLRNVLEGPPGGPNPENDNDEPSSDKQQQETESPSPNIQIAKSVPPGIQALTVGGLSSVFMFLVARNFSKSYEIDFLISACFWSFAVGLQSAGSEYLTCKLSTSRYSLFREDENKYVNSLKATAKTAATTTAVFGVSNFFMPGNSILKEDGFAFTLFCSALSGAASVTYHHILKKRVSTFYQ